MSQSNYVHLDDCEVVALTEDLEKGDIRTVSITEWIAEQKGIDA